MTVAVRRVLVVCFGNICRSPVGARLLAARLAGRGAAVEVCSAGIGALVGHPADAMTRRVAEANGLDLDGHAGRQFTRELGRAQDLILAMEAGHRREIGRIAPDLSGRVMLFDHWTGGRDIPDPYRQSEALHRAVFAQIAAAADGWAARLVPARQT